MIRLAFALSAILFALALWGCHMTKSPASVVEKCDRQVDAQPTQLTSRGWTAPVGLVVCGDDGDCACEISYPIVLFAL